VYSIYPHSFTLQPHIIHRFSLSFFVLSPSSN
jgi:hypothetical protein